MLDILGLDTGMKEDGELSCMTTVYKNMIFTQKWEVFNFFLNRGLTWSDFYFEKHTLVKT